mmetsp:Transcript_109426/g.233876  ORF Transcript_109426/g.233876 Transcript_109426/m.233876 type:complete len:245 (+) Transcript_109426:470-1204(+)
MGQRRRSPGGGHPGLRQSLLGCGCPRPLLRHEREEILVVCALLEAMLPLADDVPVPGHGAPIGRRRRHRRAHEATGHDAALCCQPCYLARAGFLFNLALLDARSEAQGVRTPVVQEAHGVVRQLLISAALQVEHLHELLRLPRIAMVRQCGLELLDAEAVRVTADLDGGRDASKAHGGPISEQHERLVTSRIQVRKGDEATELGVETSPSPREIADGGEAPTGSPEVRPPDAIQGVGVHGTQSR